MLLYYFIIFAITVILTFVYACRWNKRYPSYCTLLYCVIPIACYAYLLLETTKTVELATFGIQLTYFGSIWGSLFFSLTIMSLSKFKIPKFLRVLLFTLALSGFLLVLTIGHNSIFYKSLEVVVQNGRTTFIKDYGPLHLYAYGVPGVFYIIAFIGVIRGLGKRYEVSQKNTIVLLIILTGSFLLFFGGRLFFKSIELLPLSYVVAQFALIFMPERIVLYDINETLVDVSGQRGDIAIISVDKHNNYLGCNDVAKQFFPILTKLKIDESIISEEKFFSTLVNWISLIKENDGKTTVTYEENDRHYAVVADYIKKNGKKIKGYTFMITDDTNENKYHQLLENYNKELERDVEKKTKEIVQINDVFGKSVSPQVRDYLLSGNVELGGKMHDITVMFCDIRSFTSLSENMPSQKVVKMLNYYFTAMERCISKHNGVINKYMGDCIMALFGVPMPSENHQQEAFDAALDMRKMLDALNKQFLAKGYPELHFGIGLHSGQVLAGNIGSENRMEYTVIGDTVNTASRVEGLCKTYKKDLLLSEDTAIAIMSSNAQTFLEFVDYADIRGRKEKVRIFTDLKTESK